MKTKEFYSVLLPLLNHILTGNPIADCTQNRLRLSSAFIDSLSAKSIPSYNPHLLSCIRSYFKNLNEKELIQLTHFFVDNRDLLSVAVLIRDAECKSTQSKAYYNDELILILLDFLDQKTIDMTLHLTLYFYLENLMQIEIENEHISLETYRKCLVFNSRCRTKMELVNLIFQ